MVSASSPTFGGTLTAQLVGNQAQLFNFGGEAVTATVRNTGVVFSDGCVWERAV